MSSVLKSCCYDMVPSKTHTNTVMTQSPNCIPNNKVGSRTASKCPQQGHAFSGTIHGGLLCISKCNCIVFIIGCAL